MFFYSGRVLSHFLSLHLCTCLVFGRDLCASRISFEKWGKGRPPSAIIFVLFSSRMRNRCGHWRQDRDSSMTAVLSHVVAQEHHLPHISLVSIDPLAFVTPTQPPHRHVSTRLASPYHDTYKQTVSHDPLVCFLSLISLERWDAWLNLVFFLFFFPSPWILIRSRMEDFFSSHSPTFALSSLRRTYIR